MEKTLPHTLKAWFYSYWPLLLIMVGYLMFTLPALLDSDHQMKNLEPYPDGLLYALSARGLSQGQSLGLYFQESSLSLWVPPAYPIYLSFFYLLWNNPIAFYLGNVALGFVNLWLLYVIFKQFAVPPFVIFCALGLYLSHAWLWWLPTLPMTENLILPLLLSGIYGLLRRETKWGIVAALFSFGGLFLTRYSVILTTATGFALVSWAIGMNAPRRIKAQLLGISIFFSTLAYFYLLSQNLNPFTLFTSTLNSIINGNSFWGTGFVIPNFQFYGGSMLGVSHFWLWWSLPFTSIAVTLTAFYGWWSFRKKYPFEVAAMTLLGLSVFPLLLVFYQPDLRYSVLVLPVLIIGSVLGLMHLWQKNIRWRVALLAVLFFFQLPQLVIFKTLVSSQLLQRSTAWQYRSVQAFDAFTQTEKGEMLLITALPPHLVDAYQTEEYRVLPLSPAQEFLQKKQLVWGNDVPYEDLIAGYQQWLQEGRTLYISNAYITHQQVVIEDYEQYQEHFELELVAEGCQQACNIYQLKLRE